VISKYGTFLFAMLIAQISMKDKIGGYMKLCKTLYSDVNQSLETYHTIFYRLLHVPYFDAVYRTLERKVG